jgi:[calcium/calmodulin-dependent protein kinase] kinase
LGESSVSASSHTVGTTVDPAPKLEDILSIVTWRPSKYPTPTTSLRPLLANIHADGTSTFRSPPRSKRPHANVSIITPITEAPARTVSTLERELNPPGGLLGMYGSDVQLGAHVNARVLNKFKRASSWGQGDDVSDMGAASVMSVGGELNDTVKLLGAGGVESLGSPNSPITPASQNSQGGSLSGGRATSGSGSAGDVIGWDQLGEGIRRWRSARRKHRVGSSSTLPWVESFEDMSLGVTDPTRREEVNRERRSRQAQSRGELTMDWMDDNYSTPGGYYGTSMGPATQFWRHGRGGWHGQSVSSSGEEDDGPIIGPSRIGEQEREVVRRREDSLGKFLGQRNPDSEDGDDDGEGSGYESSSLRVGYKEEERRDRESEEGHEEEERRDDDESESDSEDEHAQQITIKSRGSIRR